MIPSAAWIFFTSIAFFTVIFFLGAGLAALLVPDDKSRLRFFWAPVLGTALLGGTLGYAALFGWPIRTAFLLPVGCASALFFAAGGVSILRQMFADLDLEKSAFLLWLPLFSMVLAAPFILRSSFPGTFISIGNNDPIFYSSATQRFLDGQVPHYLKLFNRADSVADSAAHERYLERMTREFASDTRRPTSTTNTLVQIADNPRWLPLETVAFFSRLFRCEPEGIAALVSLWCMVLILPAAALFSRSVLGWDPSQSWLGLALCALSPAILYIGYHGFIPQMQAMMFLIAFFSLLPDLLREDFSGRRVVLAGMALAGILLSYFELIPYLGLASGCYALAELVRGRASLGGTLIKFLCIFMVAAILCPYQVYRLEFLLYHLRGVRSGWDVTTQSFLFGLPLGVFKLKYHLLEPLKLAELTLFPVGAVLLLKGVSKAKEKMFLACFLAPFALVGAMSYARSFNYAYFKNFSYVYYLFPLLAGRGLLALYRENKSLKSAAILLSIFLALISAGNCLALVRYAVRNGYYLPKELFALKAMNDDGRVNDVFIDNLGLSDLFASVYYLRDKRLGYHTYNGFPGDNYAFGMPNDPRFQYVLEWKTARIFETPQGRPIETVVLDGPQYRLSKLGALNPNAWVNVQIPTGTASLETHLDKQWVWIGSRQDFIIESGKAHPKAMLEVDCLPQRDQVLEIRLDEGPPLRIPLQKQTPKTFTVPLPLKGGQHVLAFDAGASAPAGPFLQIFRFKITL